MSSRSLFVRPLGAGFGLATLALLLPMACGTTGTTDEGTDLGGSGGSGLGGGGGLGGAGALPPGTTSCDEPAACGLTECQAEELLGDHVSACSELSPHTNPPTSGPHYPDWAQFGIYDQPIPVGFLLHGLEHSAVALLYNCELVEQSGASCDDLVAELEAFYADYPADPLCTSVPHRLFVIPDPDLDVPFAATAWQAHLKGQCFDAERVRAFVDAHYGQNYENICYAGVDPLAQGCD